MLKLRNNQKLAGLLIMCDLRSVGARGSIAGELLTSGGTPSRSSGLPSTPRPGKWRVL